MSNDNKPAAAQEAVATYCGRRLTPEGTRECWGYLSEGVEDLPRGTKLYAAPVAAAPAFVTDGDPTWRHGAKAYTVTVENGWVQIMVVDGAHVEFIGKAKSYGASTPAAPGIDLGQIWERAHADMLARRRRNKHDCFVLRCLKDSVDALVVEQIDASPKGDVHADDLAVDAFAAAMKSKLAAARAKGRGGWDGDEPGMQQRLSDMLRDHVEKGDPRDVANFCMFLHQRGEGISPKGGSDAPAPDHIDADNGLRSYPWTYQNQPGNLGASALGACARLAKPGGDSIDHGLSLLRELHLRGFGIVRVEKLATSAEVGS